MKSKRIIKVIAFLVVLVLVFNFITRIFTVSTEDKNYQWMHGIYEERENSLDAIYIGSSNCYAFWAPNFAWEEYGIAVYPYTCSSQSLIIAEYLIKEARKTQPDAVFVVNINTLGDGEVKDAIMHRLLDFMPWSKNRMELADYMCDLRQLPFKDRLEYYFPIIRYHDKWKELTPDNFYTEMNGLKGGNIDEEYFEDVFDLSDSYRHTDEKAEISKELEDSINSLLDYCEEEKVKVVFVTVPRAEEKIESLEKFNTVNEMISERGFPVLDLMDNPEALNLNITYDYYNHTHTNIHGAIKYTYYISEYLIENYGFEDKRQDKAYEDWNQGFENYWELTQKYVLDFELDSKHRDYTLDVPEDLKSSAQETENTISWKAVENADGYMVYRRVNKDDAWKSVYDTTETDYRDTDVKSETNYYYRVVPYRIENGEKMYGNFQYISEKVKR